MPRAAIRANTIKVKPGVAASESTMTHHADDETRLRQLGYKQELVRCCCGCFLALIGLLPSWGAGILTASWLIVGRLLAERQWLHGLGHMLADAVRTHHPLAACLPACLRTAPRAEPDAQLCGVLWPAVHADRPGRLLLLRFHGAPVAAGRQCRVARVVL